MYYRRSKVEGGTYFFTVNLADRQTDLLVRYIDNLRTVINKVKARHPFAVTAMVVLPEHLHAIWHLPSGDTDYPIRWSLIKAGFSRLLEQHETIRASRRTKRERGIWQRRYWEHQIRDEMDLSRHIDYIHFNPVKHGWVTRAVDWPHSTLHGYIARGIGVVMREVMVLLVNVDVLGFLRQPNLPTIGSIKYVMRWICHGILIYPFQSGEA